jgi:hypothetical protein
MISPLICFLKLLGVRMQKAGTGGGEVLTGGRMKI